ncbi:MAG: histidine phosphatase family protein [Cyanobacteria bacterium P01_H01_bin.121]
MSLSIYFLRHGETEHSKTGGYCGALDVELTDIGVQMAEAFAAEYDQHPWTAIYCSPMKRTRATVKPLCDRTGLQPEFRDGLKELQYGQWEDKTPAVLQQEFASDYVRWLTEPAWNPPTGGETATEVASRAQLVITEIKEKYPDGNVLVVSHKTTIRVIICSLLGIDLGRYRDRIEMPVASVSIVKFDVHGPMLRCLADRSHFPPELRNLPGT